MSLVLDSDTVSPDVQRTLALAELPDPAALYRETVDLLRRLAERRFHVPADDAMALVHDVFVSYLGAAPTIRKPHDWLVSAICNACRYYWRCRGREVPLPVELLTRADPATDGWEDRVLTRLLIQAVLARLDPRSRDVLRLRFEDGCKIHEVARQLGVTEKRAEKLLYRSLGRMRVLYARLLEP